jgi:hypothetical protein
LELGRLAVEVKQTLPHGDWIPWLESQGYNPRFVQRAMQIFLAFAGHETDLAGLTVTEALKFGDGLAAVDAEEKKALEDSEEAVSKKYGKLVGKAMDDEARKIRAAAAQKRKELRQKVLAVLAANGDLETELQAIIDPQQAVTAEDQAKPTEDQPVPSAEQLLTEATDGALKLRDIHAALHGETSSGSAAETLCRYLCEVFLPDFVVLPDERAAFELFAEECGGEQRALVVTLALTQHLLDEDVEDEIPDEVAEDEIPDEGAADAVPADAAADGDER